MVALSPPKLLAIGCAFLCLVLSIPALVVPAWFVSEDSSGNGTTLTTSIGLIDYCVELENSTGTYEECGTINDLVELIDEFTNETDSYYHTVQTAQSIMISEVAFGSLSLVSMALIPLTFNVPLRGVALLSTLLTMVLLFSTIGVFVGATEDELEDIPDNVVDVEYGYGASLILASFASVFSFVSLAAGAFAFRMEQMEGTN